MTPISDKPGRSSGQDRAQLLRFPTTPSYVSPMLRLADWTQQAQQSTIQQLLAVTTHPDIISFALGLPAAELFPAQAYARVVADMLSKDRQVLQYGMPCQLLKQEIVKLMSMRGVSCSEEQIFLTAGALQAMSLLSRLLLNAHSTVLVEETIYSGILQAIEPQQPKILTVPTHADTGIDIEVLATLLKDGHLPSLIYVITDGHNPLGVSMSMDKRQRIVDLARQYGVPILEDDAYGLLNYDQSPLPPLRALDDEWVFYMGSFSKILAPSLRVGWMVVPTQLMPLLAALKEGSDINTATFAQRTIAAYLVTGQLPAHVAMLRNEYRRQRDAMIEAVKTHFPVGTRYYTPTHGMFLWVMLPGDRDTEKLLRNAIEEEHVAYVPGRAFCVSANTYAGQCMRLNFSHCSVARIEQGIAKLGRVLS